MASFLERMRANRHAAAAVSEVKKRAKVVENELLSTVITAGTATALGLAEGMYGTEKMSILKSKDETDPTKTKVGTGVPIAAVVGVVGKIGELLAVSSMKGNDLKPAKYLGTIADTALAVFFKDSAVGWGQRMKSKKDKATITTTISTTYADDPSKNTTLVKTVDGGKAADYTGSTGFAGAGYQPQELNPYQQPYQISGQTTPEEQADYARQMHEAALRSNG